MMAAAQQQTIDLIATPRPPVTDHGNLFVRLPPQTARDLYNLALRHNNQETNEISSLSPCDELEFLPLEMTFKTKYGPLEAITVYGSYNGGAPAKSSPLSTPYRNGQVDNFIEISLDLHPSLKKIFNSSSEPVIASVRAIPSVPYAKEVIFEPLSTSDWELIEMEASVLENGGLLNQITIVYPGQVLPMRLGSSADAKSFGRIETAAWVKVVVQDGQRSDDDESILSESDSESSLSHDDKPLGSSIQCLQLMAETEVIVIPKPRVKEPKQKTETKDQPINLPSKPFRVQPTTYDYGCANHDLDALSYLPSPQIGNVYVHPAMVSELPGYYCGGMEKCDTVVLRRTRSPSCHSFEYNINRPEESSEISVARINFDKKVKKGHIVLHPYMRYQMGVYLYKDWISLQLVSPYFVERSGVNLRKEVIDGKVTVRFKALTIDVDKSGNPWRFPDELDQCCKNESEHWDCLSSDSSSLICQGSIVSAKYLSILGISISEHPNDLFRIEFTSVPLSNKTDKHEIGHIVRECDLADLIKIESPKETTVSKDKQMIISEDDSLFIQGMMFSTGNDRFERVVSSSASDIISKIPWTSQACSINDRQLFIGITGEKGSGKTHCALHIASRLSQSHNYAVVYLGCRKLQSSSQSTLALILSELQKVFCEAVINKPSVLILDDIDSLIPNVDLGDSGDGSIQYQMSNPSLISQVKVIVDHLHLLAKGVDDGLVCFCTHKDISSLSSRFTPMIHSVVTVPSFDALQRTEFLCQHLFGLAKHQEVPPFISRLGKNTDGYRPRDLQMIAKRIHNASQLRDLCYSGKFSNSKHSLSECDIDGIIQDYTPLSHQSLNISQNDNVVEWQSIGGLFRAKEVLRDTIIHPMKFRQVYNNAPTKLPTGVLIFGYPGCGKSWIVPSLAKISNLNLITCRGPELLDRYIGASEAKVRQIFARAAAAAPSLLFFDEFDSLAPQRGSDHTGVTDRVVNQLLTLLDGAESNAKSNIFIVAATSRPDKIDNALLRPGRLEKHIYIGYPESQSEWNSLFSSILKTRVLDEEVKLLQQKEDLFSAFCQDLNHAKGFCAADLKAVLDTAHLSAVHEILEQSETDQKSHCQVMIRKHHIVSAFKRTRPSLLPSDKSKFQRFFRPFLGEDNKNGCLEWIDSSMKMNPNTDKEYSYSGIELKTSLR